MHKTLDPAGHDCMDRRYERGSRMNSHNDGEPGNGESYRGKE